MRKKKWTVPALTGIGVLLFLLMSASLLGVSYAGVRVVPAAVEKSVVPVGSGLSADSAAYWLRVELEPSELYDLALRQTVRIFVDDKDENGEVIGTKNGAGVIASQDGYILTNSHVVIAAKNAGETVRVELYDGSTFEGTVLGADPETEVALLKIEAQGLSAAQFGSSQDLLPCQTVYAMGHPSEELTYTMTSGIICGLDRTIPFPDGTELHMFQFDAAVNFGNSGGPVYDLMGNVVGIVTAKYFFFDTQGIGLALPIDDVLSIAEELKTHGYVTGRPLLGVTVQSITENKIVKGSPAGSMIYSVEEGLAAARAGLKYGDIIVGINDRTVTDNESLNAAKNGFRAGETVTVRFWRVGEFMEAELTFDEVTPEHPVGQVIVVEEEAPETEEEAEGYEGLPESEPEPEAAPETDAEA